MVGNAVLGVTMWYVVACSAQTTDAVQMETVRKDWAQGGERKSYKATEEFRGVDNGDVDCGSVQALVILRPWLDFPSVIDAQVTVLFAPMRGRR